jgi:hypothetical protein
MVHWWGAGHNAMKNGMFEIVHVIHVFNGELHK